MDCSNILLYHDISKKFLISFKSISSTLFRKHLIYLNNKGLNSILIPELLNDSSVKKKQSVLITFDDAYEGVYYSAFPLMEEFGFKGVVFMPSGYIGKFNDWDFTLIGRLRHMDKNMLIDLSKNGWIIGSHGYSHIDLRRCSKKALKREICDSKKILEDIIGEEVFLFAYPFGLYNERVINTVEDCGYKYAFVTSKGVIGNRFAIPRMALYFIDPSPLPLLNNKTCKFYLFRNRIISHFASLTPIYKRLRNHL